MKTMPYWKVKLAKEILDPIKDKIFNFVSTQPENVFGGVTEKQIADGIKLDLYTTKIGLIELARDAMNVPTNSATLSCWVNQKAPHKGPLRYFINNVQYVQRK